MILFFIFYRKIKHEEIYQGNITIYQKSKTIISPASLKLEYFTDFSVNHKVNISFKIPYYGKHFSNIIGISYMPSFFICVGSKSSHQLNESWIFNFLSNLPVTFDNSIYSDMRQLYPDDKDVFDLFMLHFKISNSSISNKIWLSNKIDGKIISYKNDIMFTLLQMNYTLFKQTNSVFLAFLGISTIFSIFAWNNLNSHNSPSNNVLKNYLNPLTLIILTSSDISLTFSLFEIQIIKPFLFYFILLARASMFIFQEIPLLFIMYRAIELDLQLLFFSFFLLLFILISYVTSFPFIGSNIFGDVTRSFAFIPQIIFGIFDKKYQITPSKFTILYAISLSFIFFHNHFLENIFNVKSPLKGTLLFFSTWTQVMVLYFQTRKAKKTAYLYDAPNEEADECPICLLPIELGDGAKTPCEHLFHKNCLIRWMAIKNECPLCRNPIPPYNDSETLYHSV